MTYATLDQLTDRFGERMLIELSDRAEPATGMVDATVVGRAQADTDATIDGYLAGLYALPIAGDVPPMLTDLALAIAIYKLHRYEPDEKIRKDYEQALKDLDRISKGAIKLPIDGAEPQAKQGSGVLTNDRLRPFTEENMTGFI